MIPSFYGFKVTCVAVNASPTDAVRRTFTLYKFSASKAYYLGGTDLAAAALNMGSSKTYQPNSGRSHPHRGNYKPIYRH